jgi:hypothetical protein
MRRRTAHFVDHGEGAPQSELERWEPEAARDGGTGTRSVA